MVVLLVFLLVAPALSLALISPFNAISSLVEWRNAVDECMRLGKAAPPFRWRHFGFSVEEVALIYIALSLLYLAAAVVPVVWTVRRGSLPVLIVMLSCCLVAAGLAVASNALSMSVLGLFVAVCLACWSLLRWIGVPKAPPAGPAQPD